MNTVIENMQDETPAELVRRFLQAVDSGSLAAVESVWADDPSMFFPFLDTPDLAAGKSPILARFAALFEKFRLAGAKPPYFHFDLENLRVDTMGEIALCTFTYHTRNVLARRTVILRREARSWRIKHVHGSNAAMAGEVRND